MNQQVISFRARNARKQRRKLDRVLRSMRRSHPDLRVVSVNGVRRGALQWSPGQLDTTVVVEWGSTA